MADYMEENLDMPLGKVLSIIQSRIMTRTTYFGVRAFKSPTDYWVYQEIIFEIQPDVIIEIGNADGGGILFLAHICDLLGKGKVLGIDLSHDHVPEHIKQHPRVTLIEGGACRSFDRVRKRISIEESVLVIEDSSHTYDNTLNILRKYAPLIKPGGHFIVEDGICHHGLPFGPMPGPYEAVETFVKENTDFYIDRSRESFLITWNPKGYLRRKSAGSENSDKEESKPLSISQSGPGLSSGKIFVSFIPPILVQLTRKLVRFWTRITNR